MLQLVEQLLFHMLKNGINVGEVFVKGAAVVPGFVRNFLNRDLLQPLHAVELPEGFNEVLAGLLGDFLLFVHKPFTLLLRLLRHNPTFTLTLLVDGGSGIPYNEIIQQHVGCSQPIAMERG